MEFLLIELHPAVAVLALAPVIYWALVSIKKTFTK